MKRTAFIFLAVIGLTLIHQTAFAWGGAGHQLIAAEAYRQLSPELKAQTFEVLKSHPDFVKWTNAYQPNANFDRAAYVFMRSSTWPDEIRRKGNKYDHPNWHFIDYPLRPPAFTFEPDAKPADNVLFGISECEKALSNTNADPELRAAYLSWLVHLLGDEHQPLHCESLFTADYPNGDKGGNSFYVMPAQRVIGLHSIWDGLLGSSINPRTQWNYAIELENKFPTNALPELKAHTTPKEWSLESRELAIEKAYLHGELKGSTNKNEAPVLPPDYTKNAKAVGERQGALAGHRLAFQIQKYLKCGPVSLLPQITFTAAPTTAPKKIGATEASKYYDQSMIVTGKVAQVSARPTITIINLDAAGQNSPFAAVIFPEHLSSFPDIQKFQGQSVEISGTITEYRNKPEIILETPDQLKVVGEK